LLSAGGDIIDKVHMNAIVDDDIILAVLREDLLPKFDSTFQTLSRQIQSLGESRGGQRQYCYDDSGKPQPHLFPYSLARHFITTTFFAIRPEPRPARDPRGCRMAANRPDRAGPVLPRA